MTSNESEKNKDQQSEITPVPDIEDEPGWLIGVAGRSELGETIVLGGK